jgi:hypothetical protein
LSSGKKLGLEGAVKVICPGSNLWTYDCPSDNPYRTQMRWLSIICREPVWT